jgi:DNA repair protein RadC
MLMGLHDGHRKKCAERFLTGGLEPFADHEALELLLFYAIPRRDTNETAHRLLERYGSLQAVLQRAAGGSAKGAGHRGKRGGPLKLVTGNLAEVQLSGNGREIILNSTDKAGAYLLDLFSGEKNEVIYQLCLDSKGKLLACKRLGEGGADNAELNVRSLVENALLSSASAVILSHNHPSGIALPSREDYAATHRVQEAPPATSRRPSKSWRRAFKTAWTSRCCWASPAPARPTPWPRSSSRCSAPRWCWPTTRRWPPSCAASSRSFSRTTPWSILSPTTTTISRRPISPTRTPISKRTAAINDEIDRLRLSATFSLLERRDVIVVSSVSCIYGLGEPEDFAGMVVSLRVGGAEPDELLLRLVEIRYERNDVAFERNMFRVRGDTVEIYPAYLPKDSAIRVEFFGDEIDRISEFNPSPACGPAR